MTRAAPALAAKMPGMPRGVDAAWLGRQMLDLSDCSEW
jgi:hypothetical protein